MNYLKTSFLRYSEIDWSLGAASIVLHRHLAGEVSCPALAGLRTEAFQYEHELVAKEANVCGGLWPPCDSLSSASVLS